MPIQTRSSVLGVKEEIVEGVLTFPTSSSDFVALQDDFSMEASFDVLENAELKSSIGTSKPILGAENPSASLSHYLRASGVVGQAPNFGVFLKAGIGDEVVASTEYDTAAGSTVSVLNVGVGEGVNFQRGQGLLIKDGVNGYRIRCIDEVNADALTIGFQVPVAPGSGVNLGRAVLYKPVNQGHITLSLLHYLGNGGALQAMAGARVTSTSIDISAGELINMSFDLEGIAYYFNPVEITATSKFLDFTDDDGTHAAQIAVKTYKDPYDLASAIQSALNDSGTTETYTVKYVDATGKFKITSTSTVLSLLWNTGVNAANSIAGKIGYLVAGNDTGSAGTIGYTSDNGIGLAPPLSPTFDNSDPLAAKDNEVMIGGTEDYECFEASTVNVTIATPKSDISSICSVSGKSGSVINSREVTVEISAPLEAYQVAKFSNFRRGDEIKFQYSFGVKQGGNWVPGKCGAIYIPTATISSLSVDDNDGLAQLNLTLSGFVNADGEGEVFVSFL